VPRYLLPAREERAGALITLKGPTALRRILAPSLAFAVFALPASAAAQIPTPPGQPTPPSQPPTPAPAPAKAGLGITLQGGVKKAGKWFVIRRELVKVSGHINKAAAGETVRVELWKGKKHRGHRNAKVNKQGNFKTKLRPRGAGGFKVRAVHAKSDKVAKGKSKFVRFRSLKGHAGVGDSGPGVELLQRQLAQLGYAIPRTGHYDSATQRAVLAYRFVNRLSHTTRADHTVFERAFKGKGAFKLRYPSAGKHVEADLSRQVVVLAQDGKPYRVYHTSSGKPSTPTVTGSYRFYRKDPGYNAEGMYYSSYFIRGYAIHGYHSVPTYNASHGCLRVAIASAVAIYNWIDLGDRIFVYGHA
jgi:peptidoglycan hydrolase-like protein with peptidoglycan-binding domain